MAMDWKQIKKQLKEHLEKRFLLVIRNEDTFEETASYKLSLLNIYVLLSSVFVAVALILWLLIIISPLKRLVPGYGDVRSQTEYITLQKQITALEEEVNAQQTYISSFQRLLSGNPQTSKDVTKGVKIVQENADPIQKIKEDSILRRQFEQDPNQFANKKANKSVRPDLKLSSTSVQNLENIDFISPARGTISSLYKPEKEHFGVDIIAAKNTPVKATLSGTIIQSDWSVESGYTIAIQHDYNLISIYKHNSALLKKLGAYVKAGEAIAIIGNTGENSTGPHLHFELWFKGQPINPEQYVRMSI